MKHLGRQNLGTRGTYCEPSRQNTVSPNRAAFRPEWRLTCAVAFFNPGKCYQSLGLVFSKTDLGWSPRSFCFRLPSLQTDCRTSTIAFAISPHQASSLTGTLLLKRNVQRNSMPQKLTSYRVPGRGTCQALHDISEVGGLILELSPYVIILRNACWQPKCCSGVKALHDCWVNHIQSFVVVHVHAKLDQSPTTT